MVSSKFSGPAPIQQPPPVCKKGPPKPPVPPPGGPTLWVEAEWKGVDLTGIYRTFNTAAAFIPDLPADAFDATAVTPEGWNFHCTIDRLDPTTWNCHVAWSPTGPPNSCSADGNVTIDTTPPIQTPTYLLTSTEPAGQYCTVRFYNP
jgi:hypothetical protein